MSERRTPKPTYRFAGDAPPAALAHLRGERRWVAWRYEYRGSDWTKPPIDPHTGRYAQANDPRTWGTFDEALALLNRRTDLAGVSLMLTDDDDICGADLDDCITDSGSFLPLAAELVEMAETYTEISPSGEGLRLFIRGKAADPFKLAHVEVYNRKRHLTVTGNHVEGTPAEIRPAPRTHARLVSERPAPAKNAAAARPAQQDGGGRLREALSHIPADDYDDWVRVGMAIKSEMGDAGLDMWREWSASSAKFDAREASYKWGTFNGAGVSIATVYHRARDHGWREERPQRAAPLRANNGDQQIVEPARQRQEGGETPPPAAPLVATSAWELLKSEPPARVWHIPDWCPGDDVIGLFGPGGEGKTQLLLQLLYCTAAHFPWLGMTVREGAAIGLSTEEPLGELHVRVDQVARGLVLPAESPRHPLELITRAGEDAQLCTFTPAGLIQPSQLWHELVQMIGDLGARLCVIDALADVYGGNENDRQQVRQFINMLRKPAVEHQCAILLAGHPSVDGIKTGRGYSGSTHWHNGVRARMLFGTPTAAREHKNGDAEEDDDPSDPNLRQLSLEKSNRGKRGLKLSLRWRDGWFGVEHGESGDFLKIAEAKTRFLELLAARNGQGRHVSPKSTANNYAPTVFAADKAAGKRFTRGVYATAMDALFNEDRLIVGKTPGVPPSKASDIVMPA